MNARVGFFGAALIGLAESAWGATHRVPWDYPTINGGIDAAVSGDSVLVAPGTYTDYELRYTQFGDEVVSCAFLKGGVVLCSESGPDVTTIDMLGVPGSYPFVVISFDQTEPTWIDGFTITGVMDGSNAVYVAACPKLTMRNCIVRDIDARPNGLGALGAFGSELEVFHSRFVNCQAYGGGAIAQFDEDILIEGCYVEGCGNCAVFLTSDPTVHLSQAEIRNSEFVGNTSSAGGGGLFVNQYEGGVMVSGCTFRSNTAHSAGAAVLSDAGLALTTVSECVFDGNRLLNAGSRGGGISINHGALVERCTFVNNANGATATTGSDLWFANGAGTLANCIFARSQGGGAVAVTNGSISSDCNVFWQNETGIGDVAPGPRDRIVDPLFCDVEAGDYTLMAGSPCLPEASLGCGLIGAFEQACGPIAVRPESWGRLKAAFR